MRKMPENEVNAFIHDGGDCSSEEPGAEPLRLWRSIEDFAGDEQAQQFRGAEFLEPAQPEAVDRRQLLHLMTASLALGGLSGCALNSQPWGAPLLSQPYQSPQHTPGVPLMFATSLDLDGLGRGVLVKSHDGRPVKIEGNPLHPASLGATDPFAQAEVLSLYDPDRSAFPIYGRMRASWTDIWQIISGLHQRFRANAGRGLHILLEPYASPTRDRLMARAQQELPEARWHFYSPLPNDQERAAATAVFGRPLDQVFDLTRADVILTLGGDLLGAGAAHVRYAADYASRRRATDRPLPRLYSMETTPSLTGARADRRIAVPPSEIEKLAGQILAMIGRGAPPASSQSVVNAVAADLMRAGPHALVVAGREQSSNVHAIAHVLNLELGAAGQTVRYIEPLIPLNTGHMQSLVSLADDMASGRVEVLLILGGNPVYTAPANIEFLKLLQQVPTSIHLGYYRNETALACTAHLPERHALEGWGDVRAFDGTVGLRQPATIPLLETTVAEEILSRLIGEPNDAQSLVQETWQEQWGADFQSRWLQSLEAGVIAGSASPPVSVAPLPNWQAPTPASASAAGKAIVFAPDATVWDGRFANNGWLQELPKPLTKQVWGNSALMAPASAAALDLQTGDIAEFAKEGRSIEACVWVLPGHAPDCVTMPLGYGRVAAGRNGTSHGFNAYRLRTANEYWTMEGVSVIATGRHQQLATTQHHHVTEGRDIIRVVSASSPAVPPEPEPVSMYPDYVYDGNAWGMAIDLDLCLGCNSCVIACQAENNVPIVGPEEVARGREMHWLRIDRYFGGLPDEPETYFQPVLCMHCQKAPCEIVCPVNATVHSSEGLNEMVYSRCVGTRTCSNNCPYKVRRFNWFDYNRGSFATPDAIHSPEVTVRWRGVIEKCTYCVHRISAARIAAKMENRPIRDGDVVTACQQACPTKAIVFGNINDAQSAVAGQKNDPRNYALLGELNTRPRTTYLARISSNIPARVGGGDGDDAG